MACQSRRGIASALKKIKVAATTKKVSKLAKFSSSASLCHSTAGDCHLTASLPSPFDFKKCEISDAKRRRRNAFGKSPRFSREELARQSLQPEEEDDDVVDEEEEEEDDAVEKLRTSSSRILGSRLRRRRCGPALERERSLFFVGLSFSLAAAAAALISFSFLPL